MADGYILQIHSQLVMLSFGIELGIKKFSFANSGFIIAIVEHPNLKTKLRFLQPINPMVKRICYCLCIHCKFSLGILNMVKDLDMYTNKNISNALHHAQIQCHLLYNKHCILAQLGAGLVSVRLKNSNYYINIASGNAWHIVDQKTSL